MESVNNVFRLFLLRSCVWDFFCRSRLFFGFCIVFLLFDVNFRGIVRSILVFCFSYFFIFEKKPQNLFAFLKSATGRSNDKRTQREAIFCLKVTEIDLFKVSYFRKKDGSPDRI